MAQQVCCHFEETLLGPAAGRALEPYSRMAFGGNQRWSAYYAGSEPQVLGAALSVHSKGHQPMWFQIRLSVHGPGGWDLDNFPSGMRIQKRVSLEAILVPEGPVDLFIRPAGDSRGA